jgi:hypothetical protein
MLVYLVKAIKYSYSYYNVKILERGNEIASLICAILVAATTRGREGDGFGVFQNTTGGGYTRKHRRVGFCCLHARFSHSCFVPHLAEDIYPHPSQGEQYSLNILCIYLYLFLKKLTKIILLQ